MYSGGKSRAGVFYHFVTEPSRRQRVIRRLCKIPNMKNRDKRNSSRKKPPFNVSSTTAKVLVISPFVKRVMLPFTEETKPGKDQVTYWVPEGKWPNSQVHAQNHYSKFTLLVIRYKRNRNRRTQGRQRPTGLSEELKDGWKARGPVSILRISLLMGATYCPANTLRTSPFWTILQKSAAPDL